MRGRGDHVLGATTGAGRQASASGPAAAIVLGVGGGAGNVALADDSYGWGVAQLKSKRGNCGPGFKRTPPKTSPAILNWGTKSCRA